MFDHLLSSNTDQIIASHNIYCQMSMWSPYHKKLDLIWPKKSPQKSTLPKQSDGYFLSEPRTEKLHGENVFLNGLEIGHSSIQGFRPSMEDSHLIVDMGFENHTLCGIFDGHAGAGCSKVASETLLNILIATPQWLEYMALPQELRADNSIELISLALVKAYVELDEQLRISAEAVRFLPSYFWE